MVVMVRREHDGQSRLLPCRDIDSPQRPTLEGCFQKELAEGGRFTLKVGFWAPRLSGREKVSGTPSTNSAALPDSGHNVISFLLLLALAKAVSITMPSPL